MKLYEAVMRHRAAGESYNEIIRAVEEELHVRLNKSHVSNWIRSDHLPDGSLTKFVPVPTAKLGYVVGVMLGDGSMSVSGDHCYRLKLRVGDRDFAQAFADAIAVVLDRPAPHVRYHAKTNQWHVDVSNYLLQQFLKKPVSEIGTVIRQTEECSCGFLRGFFDSEGCIHKRKLTVHNGDLTLLNFVANRLTALNIEFTGPHLESEGGHSVMIRGIMRRQNLNEYMLYVRTGSLTIFHEKVGFSIRRKSDRLALAVSRAKFSRR